MPILHDGPGPYVYIPRMVVSTLSASATTVGSLGGHKYAAEPKTQVNSNEDVTNLGAIVETYDPEWIAWLAGDI